MGRQRQEHDMATSKPKPEPQARGEVADDITVAADHIAVYNNMEVPDAKTVEAVGVILDPGWS
jgi:hypothetical protein